MAFNKTKLNGKLGKEVQEHLIKMGVNTPMTSLVNTDAKDKIAAIEHHMTKIMEVMGMDLTDDSLVETPNRMAKMFVLEDFWGMLPENFPKITTIENKFHADEMLGINDLRIISRCEHHWEKIIGKATFAYIPGERIVGLSKIQRVVDWACKQATVQERLLEQIWHILSYILQTENVAVTISAEHLCMTTRGVESVGTKTFNSKLGGAFKNEPAVRMEYLNFCNLGK